jgi:hypothetical protein
MSTKRVHKPVAPPSYERDVAPLLDRYCATCHNGAARSAGIAFDGGDLDRTAHDRRLGQRIANVLRLGDMPPPEEPQPSSSELETLNAWLDTNLVDRDHNRARNVVRRLNRAEYNNTLRDLLGLDLHLADDFPADDVGHGFDNNGEVLATSPVLFEMLLDAAEKAIAGAFAEPRLRSKILNPAADQIPRHFRKYTPPVRAFREKDRAIPRIAAPDPELQRSQYIYDVLRAFADRAFRRPATHEELMRLVAVVDANEKNGASLDAAIQTALSAVLVSPQFLFRLEAPSDRPVSSASETRGIDNFVLASRLSYLLWSSMPDEALLALAAAGKLHESETLRSQTMRMLIDPKSRVLAENFGDQWLQTRALRGVVPDPGRFPGLDESLRSAMIEETRLFFRSIQNEDRSILEFLDGQYTFVNERLARHYGNAGVHGPEFRRVSLEGTPRGGVLTHASVLAVTSMPTRTSPVKRGRWILDNILGAAPAPPPSGVEALRESTADTSALSVRGRIERHAIDPACAGCHRRMDPLGFGLENFDAIGRWRTLDEGHPVDSTGTLPNGQAFDGPRAMRKALLARPDVFARCLAEKLLTYALGRGLDRSDRRAVDEIVERVRIERYRFSALVLALVESDPFQGREVEEAIAQ